MGTILGSADDYSESNPKDPATDNTNSRSSPTSDGGASHAMTQPAEISNIVGLPQFERFVFVMSVLERYSYQECSLLLDCTRSDVIAAQTRYSRSQGRRSFLAKWVSIDSDEQALPDSPGSLPQAGTVRRVESVLGQAWPRGCSELPPPRPSNPMFPMLRWLKMSPEFTCTLASWPRIPAVP